MSGFLKSLGRKGKDIVKKKMGNPGERGGGLDPQYNILTNATFTEGTEGWYGLGCSLSLQQFGGSSYCRTYDRKDTWNGVAQEIGDKLETNVEYRVEAWVGIEGNAEQAQVIATVKVEKASGGDDYIWLGSVGVTKGRWSQFSGKFRLVNTPAKATFYFEGPGEGIDILVSSAAVISPNPPQNQMDKNPTAQPQAMDNSQASKPGGEDLSGLIKNAEFNDDLQYWRAKHCKLNLSGGMDGGSIRPCTGKRFAVAEDRRESWQGMEQEITGRIQESVLYKVTGKVRIKGSVSEADVLATLYVKGFGDNKDKEQYITLARVKANNHQWSEFSGDFIMNQLPKLAVVYFEGPPGGVHILLDSFSIFVPPRPKPASRPILKDPKIGVNIIENATLDKGLHGWWAMGNCRLSVSDGSPRWLGGNAAKSYIGMAPPSFSGNFIYASNRTQVWEGPAQTLTDKIQLFNTYQVTAWVATAFPPGYGGPRVPQRVNIAINVNDNWTQGGEVYAESQWTEVSGSFRLEAKPKNVIVYFQGPAPGVDVMVSGLHVFAVDRLARVPYLQEQTDRVRKCNVVLRLRDSNGHPLPPGTRLSIQQTKNNFPIGTCISQCNLANKGYTKFFLENFNWAVFDNEVKWGWTEPNQGELRYAEADEMVALCNQNGILMRGHCIVWETEDTVQGWLKKLDSRRLEEAVQNRVSGLLSRYQGQFKHYDVNNEMLHGSFYKDIFGAQFWPYLFKLAHQFDPQAILFVNDYHVEDCYDCNASPKKYVEHIRELQANGAPVGGIGVQGHLDVPIGPVIAEALDELATVGLPVWFTEVDVESVNEHLRADDLEVIFREAYAHPAVEGLMLWGFWEGAMCRKNSQLVDSDKRVNEAGRRFLALKKEWLTSLEGETTDQGQICFRGFQGEYNVSVHGRNTSKNFTVTKGDGHSVVELTV